MTKVDDVLMLGRTIKNTGCAEVALWDFPGPLLIAMVHGKEPMIALTDSRQAIPAVIDELLTLHPEGAWIVSIVADVFQQKLPLDHDVPHQGELEEDYVSNPESTVRMAITATVYEDDGTITSSCTYYAWDDQGRPLWQETEDEWKPAVSPIHTEIARCFPHTTFVLAEVPGSE